jgi:Domain of unknown function (DUF4331)
MRNVLIRALGGLAAGLALIAGILVVPGTSSGADHRDGPRIKATTATMGNLDLNDLYLFQNPTNRRNTVMIMTCSPGAGVLSPTTFAPGAFYDFNVVNTGGTTADLIVRTVFSDPDAVGRQNYQVFLMRGTSVQLLAGGTTGKVTKVRSGGTTTAGIFDDPFFFDLLAFMKFDSAVEQGLGLADRVAPFVAPSIPNNFFANFNTLAIAIEIPSTRLVSGRQNSKIGVWISTHVNGVQFDRTAIPAVNTAVNFAQPASGLPSLQDAFNTLQPSDDIALRPEAARRINLAYGLPLDKATILAATVLPDIMPFDTTNRSGFLNGRQLEDDVIDAELALLTGGALTTDRVVNDSPFRTKFPFLAPALPRRAGDAIRSARGAFEMEQQLQAPDADADEG